MTLKKHWKLPHIAVAELTLLMPLLLAVVPHSLMVAPPPNVTAKFPQVTPLSMAGSTPASQLPRPVVRGGNWGGVGIKSLVPDSSYSGIAMKFHTPSVRPDKYYSGSEIWAGLGVGNHWFEQAGVQILTLGAHTVRSDIWVQVWHGYRIVVNEVLPVTFHPGDVVDVVLTPSRTHAGMEKITVEDQSANVSLAAYAPIPAQGWRNAEFITEPMEASNNSLSFAVALPPAAAAVPYQGAALVKRKSQKTQWVPLLSHGRVSNMAAPVVSYRLGWGPKDFFGFGTASALITVNPQPDRLFIVSGISGVSDYSGHIVKQSNFAEYQHGTLASWIK